MPSQAAIDKILSRYPAGSKFGGWMINYVGNDKEIIDENTVVRGDMWLSPYIIKSEYTVWFSIENGRWEGSGAKQIQRTVAAGECLKPEDIPVPVPNAGFTVSGWYDGDFLIQGPSTTKPINFDHSYTIKCVPAVQKYVSFYINGQLYKSIGVTQGWTLAGSDLELPIPAADPTDHMIFRGWYLAGTDTPFTENTVISESMKVEARIDEAWVVTFQGHAPFEVLPGTVLGYADEMADGLYEYDAPNFKGWFATVNGQETRITLYTKVTGDLDIWPKLADMYTVTFKDALDTDYAVISNVTEGTTLTDAQMPAAPAPADDDHIFDGWMANGKPFTGATTITGNTVVKPQWKAKEITVTLNGETELVLRPGEQLTLPAAAAAPYANMVCTGWILGDEVLGCNASCAYEDLKGLVQWNEDGTAQYAIAAKFEYLYTVTFDFQDGTEVETVTWTSKEPAQSTVEAPEAHVRDGFQFMGWSNDKTTVLDQIGVKDKEFTTSFYAVWKNVYTVTFKNLNGDAVATYNVTAGGKLSENKEFEQLPAMAASDRYHVVSGWQVNGKAFDADRVVTGDLTVTYTEAPAQIQLTFVENLDKYTAPPVTVITYDSDSLSGHIWMPEIPEPCYDVGQKFLGWRVSGDGIDPAQNWILGANADATARTFIDAGVNIETGVGKITLTAAFEDAIPKVKAEFASGETGNDLTILEDLTVTKAKDGSFQIELTLPDAAAWEGRAFTGWKYGYDKKTYEVTGEAITLPMEENYTELTVYFTAQYELMEGVNPDTVKVVMNDTEMDVELRTNDDGSRYVEFTIPETVDTTVTDGFTFIGLHTDYTPGVYYKPGDTVRLDNVDPSRPIRLAIQSAENTTHVVSIYDFDSKLISAVTVAFGKSIGSKMPSRTVENKIRVVLPENAEFKGWCYYLGDDVVPFDGTTCVYDNLSVYPNISYENANVTAAVTYLTGRLKEVSAYTDEVKLERDGTGYWLANFTLPTEAEVEPWENHKLVSWEDTRNGARYGVGETVSVPCWLDSNGVQLRFEAVYEYDENAGKPAAFSVILRSQVNTDAKIYQDMEVALLGEEGAYYVEFTIPTLKVTVPSGYVFGGWQVLGDSTLYQPGDAVRMPVESLDEPIWLYAYNAKASSHTVSFYNEKGELIRTATVSYGKGAGAANMPTQKDIDQIMACYPAGSVFGGWIFSYENNDNVQMPFTAATPVKSNLRVYPNVLTPDVKVTFTIENGTWAGRDKSDVYQIYVVEGSKLNPLVIPIPEPLEGFKAGQWFKVKDGVEEAVTGNLIDEDLSECTEFLYVCAPVEYFKVFFFDEVSGKIVKVESVAEGTALAELPTVDDPIDGKIFNGWTTGSVPFTTDTLVTRETTVIADYMDGCIVSVNGERKGEVLPGTVLGDLLPKNTEPGFMGWFADGVEVDAKTVVNGDMDIVAKYEYVKVEFARKELLLNMQRDNEIVVEAKVSTCREDFDYQLIWVADDLKLVEIIPDGDRCVVRHKGERGSVDLLAIPFYNGKLHPEYADSCTVVIEAVSEDAVEEVKLGGSSVTAEMNQTGCAELQLFVKVNPADQDTFAASGNLANFMYIKSVEFVTKNGDRDEELSSLFNLLILDGGRIGFEPKSETKKTSVTAYLRVELGDGTSRWPIGPIKIALKKTAPKLKASS